MDIMYILFILHESLKTLLFVVTAFTVDYEVNDDSGIADYFSEFSSNRYEYLKKINDVKNLRTALT